jgi:membrane fusion protein, multidrug efflux system
VPRAQAVQATARQERAAAAISLAANDLSYTVIRAPFDGIVGGRPAEPGQQVSPRNHVIAVTPSRDKLYVVANGSRCCGRGLDQQPVAGHRRNV